MVAILLDSTGYKYIIFMTTFLCIYVYIHTLFLKGNCRHHDRSALNTFRTQGIYHHSQFTQEETGLPKRGHCTRLHSQGASSQDVHLGSLTPHHAVCHCWTLLIHSNAFLQLLVRLSSFSVCLLTICISSSVRILHVAFLMFTWYQQARTQHKLSKYLPAARQDPLRAYNSHG